MVIKLRKCRVNGRTASWLVGFAVVIELAAAAPAGAQLFERATVIRNARIVTLDGVVIERGSILVKGDSIAAIGETVKAPMFAKAIDADGKTVTSGLVDAWSALGRLGWSGHADPTSDTWDAFDRYARDDFREALRQGVTSIYIGPGGGPGIAGKGVVVQLVPGAGGSAGYLLDEDAALCVDLGSGQPAVERMGTYNDVRKQFRKALEYREALEDYEEDLEEYLEKLKERREKKKEEAKEGDAKEEEEKGEADKDKEEEETPDDKPPPPDDEESNAFARLLTARPHVPLAENDQEKKSAENGDGDKKNGEKEDELTKPTRPTPDPKSDVLLEVIDHKLPVRIEAHRSADILNALALAEEFNLDIILEGATDAYLVADNIAEAKVPVVLGRVTRTDLFEPNEFRRHTERNAAALTRAGVRWTAGSGAAHPRATRFVGLNAQLAFAHGAAKVRDGEGVADVSWMRNVTIEAARVLGLSDRIGRLAVGMQADIVVWTGDPGDPASTADRVLVAGKLAYAAPKGKGGGS